MKWLIKRYMIDAHIESLVELSKRTGIAKRTLYDRIHDQSTLKLFELNALDEILHFSEEDIIKLIRGQF